MRRHILVVSEKMIKILTRKRFSEKPIVAFTNSTVFTPQPEKSRVVIIVTIVLL